MLRPPVATGRRRAAADTTATSAAYPYPKPPPPKGSKAKPPATKEDKKHLAQAQFKLSSFQLQLKGYMERPFAEVVAKRQGLQGKRVQFLSLLQQLIKMQETMSASKVWLCVEQERTLEQLSRRLELRTKGLQHQRRIQELLLRTDPKVSPADLKAGLAHLTRQAHLDSIALILETVEAQQVGYRELAKEYAPTLVEDDAARREDIQWAQAFLPKIVDGVNALAQDSEALRTRVLERYLVRRHNTKLLQQGLEETQAKAGPEKARLEEDLAQLGIKYRAELEARKAAVLEKAAGRQEALRRKVVAREEELKELEAAQAQIQEAYEYRVRELRERIAHQKMEVEEWAEMRKEAHVFFSSSLKDVRDRLRAFEMTRNAELLGLGELMDIFSLLNAQQEEEEEEEEEGYESDGEEEEYGEGEESEDGSEDDFL